VFPSVPVSGGVCFHILQHIPPPQRQKKTSEPETEKAALSAELLTRTAFIGCGWLEVEPISSPENIKKYATMYHPANMLSMAKKQGFAAF
jgi:hypothetical protein